MEVPNTDDHLAANALHAAEVFLQRHAFDADSVACVTIAPRAGVGVWQPGRASVSMLATIDDAGAELCEAAAPVAQRVLRELAITEHEAITAACLAGARLQLLLAPATGEAALRLTGNGGAVEVGRVAVERNLH